MADISVASPAVGTGPAFGYTVSRTVPDELLRHDISDEELTELCAMRKDHIIEILWGAMGAALGSLAAFIDNLSKIYDGKPISFGDFFETSVFVVGLAVSIFCGWLWHNRHSREGTLEQRIRARRKDKVS